MSSDGMLSTGCPTSSLKKLAREAFGLPRLTRSASAVGDATPFCCCCGPAPSSTRARLPCCSAQFEFQDDVAPECLHCCHCTRALLLPGVGCGARNRLVSGTQWQEQGGTRNGTVM